MIPVTNHIDADLIVVGGGIGGPMAAIAAAETGVENIVVLEKCNVRRSGSGASGNDHFICYIPEYHGDNVEPLVNQLQGSFIGLGKDPAMLRLQLLESFDIVKKWETWGVDMRPTGQWNFQGHTMPGKPCPFLKMNGRNQKAVLAKKMKELGIKVLNHHPVVELALENGRVAGALALNMRAKESAFTLVRSKSVVLATGLTHRLYVNGATPNFMFNTSHCPNNAGGQALGYRIGANMVNMELPYTHAGPKFFQRAGKGTWIGVYRYPDGKPLGPFVTKPDPKYGDVTSDIWNTAFIDVMHNGRGPAYLDCSEDSPETLANMRKGMLDEGLSALLTYMDEEGIDPAKHAVEFTRYEPTLLSRGLDVDMDGMTNVPGLYAAGDTVGNFGGGVGFAAWLGWRAGKACAKEIPLVGTYAGDIENNQAIRSKAELLSSFLEKRHGATWQEANAALNQIMNEYAAVGPYHVRSESLLTAGLEYLKNLRNSCERDMMADNQHSLMRGAEVLDLLDCAEAIMVGALERKETRGNHKRADYTFTNPLLNDKMLDVRKACNGNIITEWREQRK